MENLTEKQQQILSLSMYDYVQYRVKLRLIEEHLTEENLIAILKHIDKSIKDKDPKYVQIHVNDKTCSIFNSIGFMLSNNANFDDYKHLEKRFWRKNEDTYHHYCVAKKTLTQRLARLKRFKVFNNGNLYQETKRQINLLINQ